MADAYYKSSLYRPAEILWQDATRGIYPMKSGTTSIGFCFESPAGNPRDAHNKFFWNFQYRYRARLGYAAYMEGTDDLWTAWSEWQGSADATVSGAYGAVPQEINGEYYATMPVTLSVDNKYVCYEVQARARMLGSALLNGELTGIFAYGEWSPITALIASWRPKATELGATENADGSLTVTCNTSWGESGNSTHIWQVWKYRDMQDTELTAPGDDDGWEIDIPAGLWQAVNGYALLGIRSMSSYGLRWDYSAFGEVSGGSFKFPDGSETELEDYDAGLEYAAAKIGTKVASDAIKAALEIEESGTGLKLSVEANESLDYAYAVATWVDALGNPGRQAVEMSGSGKSWVAEFPLVPFNRPVTFEARLGSADEFATFTRTATLPAKYVSWVSDAGEEVRLKWDVSVSEDWEPEAEAVKTMGSELPLPRFGKGGSNKITLSGKAISWDGTGWKPVLEKLKNATVWTLRLTDGEVRRAMVTGYSISTENSTANDIADISVQCEEVSE